MYGGYEESLRNITKGKIHFSSLFPMAMAANRAEFSCFNFSCSTRIVAESWKYIKNVRTELFIGIKRVDLSELLYLQLQVLYSSLLLLQLSHQV